MITCNLMGGLGNQLFQIFTTISYSLQSKQPFKFVNTDYLGEGKTTRRPTYWRNFLNQLTPFLMNHFPVNFKIIREKSFPYYHIPINNFIGNNILLYGYFQSYKYFDIMYSTIYELLDIQNKKEEVIDTFYTYEIINDEIPDLDNTISVHFRLGDYKNKTEYHPIMSYNYYEDALKLLQDKCQCAFDILYFCEDEDIDDVTETINKLIIKFPKFIFKRASSMLEDWQQMLLMSCCRYNIIANSSFSWWAGYLNTYEDKVVIYPSIWFGEIAGHDTKDLCPPDWFQIELK